MASLSYSESLRVLGESLEVLGVNAFDLEKHGHGYIVRVTAGKPVAEQSFGKTISQGLWRARSSKEPADPRPLCYTLADIFRVVDEQRSRHSKSNAIPDAHKLPQVLRVVGYHLDRKVARAFTISVSSHAVSVCYESGGGHQTRESFTVENLYDFAVHMYLHRSKRSLSNDLLEYQSC